MEVSWLVGYEMGSEFYRFEHGESIYKDLLSWLILFAIHALRRESRKCI